jgi:3-hydroxyisobutyrate dehydrogenase-like beta-hydroxyacid dehydrogenase
MSTFLNVFQLIFQGVPHDRMEQTMKHRLGFIGLGMMGLPMAKRLSKAGSQFAVFNRTKRKAEGLLSEGAQWCDTPAGVASSSDIVFSMVSNPDALRSIALGPDGVLARLKSGGLHIDTSTVSPSITRDLAEQYVARRCHFLHAPVLGSIPQATDGTLLMFAGGDAEAYRTAEPYLQLLAKQIWRFGLPDQATHMKLICNLFIAGMVTTLGQALIFAEKANVDQRMMLDIIGQSQLSSPMYQTKGTSIIQNNFSPRFFLEHMLKDVNLILDAARDVHAPLPAIEIAQQLFAEAHRAGYGHEDYSAVVKALQTRGGKQG